MEIKLSKLQLKLSSKSTMLNKLNREQSLCVFGDHVEQVLNIFLLTQRLLSLK